MQTAGIAIVVLLTIALVGLIVYLIVRLVQIGMGILHYYRHERRPQREFHDSRFGTLTGEGSIWEGHLQFSSNDIKFCVGGDELRPNARLLDRVLEMAPYLNKLKADALDMIHRENPECENEHLTFDSLTLLFEDNPNRCMLQFNPSTHDFRSYIVHCEGYRPVSSGYED